MKVKDIGLGSGVRALWQENRLYDYTIKVQGQQFRAHKVVLAAVSEYFKALLSEGFIESNLDEIELHGLNADIVSNVLHFIYTGDETVIATNALEVLRCAVYLQMRRVADICVDKLSASLNYKNCLELYSVFAEYTYEDDFNMAEHYVRRNWDSVYEVCNVMELSLEGLQVLKKYWKRSEWELFLFIKEWSDVDRESRKDITRELLCQVRYCLLRSQCLTSITEMNIFTNTEGSWESLVQKALHYHRLPTHHKVLEQSDQSKFRTEPSPVVFTTEDPSTFFALDEKNKWKKYEKKVENVPGFSEGAEPTGITVNNFLIVWSRRPSTCVWYIFDPITLKWSTLANMEKQRSWFVLLHHGEYLYAVGGNVKTPSPHSSFTWTRSYEMEQYSFKQNTWSSVAVPYAFCFHQACVLQDKIFVSSGNTYDFKGEPAARRVYCLDISIPNQEWERKAALPLWEWSEHDIAFVVNIGGEEVMLSVISELHMHYYSPAKDQWTYFDWTSNARYREGYYDCSGGMMLVRQNHLYILNVILDGYWSDSSESEDDIEELEMKPRVCFKWQIPQRGRYVTNIPTEDFPLLPTPYDQNPVTVFGAVLAVPH